MEGWCLLLTSWSLLAVSTYTMLLSKILPTPDNPTLRAIAQDRHYCLMPAASLVMLVVFVVVNWMGLKYFKHN
jgi:hypothetical protein